MLRRATVVICTVNNSGTPQILHTIQTGSCLMDGDAKMIEPDASITLAHYMLASDVMVGAHKQMKQTILCRESPNQQFSERMTMSFFTRLI